MQFSYKISFRYYLPLFFLLCFSGNPIFNAMPYSEPLLVGYSIFFIGFTIVYGIQWKLNKSILNYLLLLISFIGLLVFLQYQVLGFVSYPGILGLILKIVLGLFTLLYYKHKHINFQKVYIKTIAFLAMVSLPFFLLNQFGTYGIELPVERKSLFLYTSYPNSQWEMLVRNSGMFWEPGAFAGYLILGLIFVVWENGDFQLGPYKKEVLVITVGLLTTMSTTGYIIYSIILSIFSIRNFKWGKLFVAPIILLIIYWGYFNLPFMQDKITQQYTAAQQLEVGDVSNTRFGTILMDWQYISARPVIGNGLDANTRYRFHPNLEMKGFGNGMTDFIADWGFLLFLWWSYCMFRSAYKQTYSISVSVLSLLLIILVLQGEQFLNHPLFLIFFTMPFVYGKMNSRV